MWTHLFLRHSIPFVSYNSIIFNNNKTTFPSKLLHVVPQLSPNIQSNLTKVFVYVISSIFQLVYILHYAFFILIRMQFENHGTRFVFVMTSFSVHVLLMCGHYFVQYGFIQVCIFYSFFWKTSFLSFCQFCVEFDVIFTNFITSA